MKPIINFAVFWGILAIFIVSCGAAAATETSETSIVTSTVTTCETSTQEVQNLAADSAAPPATPTRLIFIHHSVGGNWLAEGNGNLGNALNTNNYYVSETNYGWDAQPGDNLGDRTNTDNWPEWFTDSKMPYVYGSDYHSAYSNNIANPGGENEIIMFKSCYPQSEVGTSIDDEKTIYNSLLPYFAAHQDKLFVLITPPGETDVSSYQLTRDLCNWLTDTDNGWLKGYTGKNVFAFDFYGVLSETDSHHRWTGDHIEHVYAADYDGKSPYHNGDDHPNSIGGQKATLEFLPLLNVAYNRWKGNEALTATATPAGGSYYNPVDVVLNSNKVADIYYTMDGTDPTKSSSKYSSFIHIATSKILKFIAFDVSDNNSGINSQYYAIYALMPYSYQVAVQYRLSNKKYRVKYAVRYLAKVGKGKKKRYVWKTKWKYKRDYLYGYRYETRYGNSYQLT